MRWFGRREGATRGNGNGNGVYDGGAGNGMAVPTDADGRRRLDPADGHGQPHPDETAERSLLLTHDGWIIGRLVHAETRVLDALSNGVLKLVADDGVREIDRDEILMVVPPPRTAPSRLRIAKQPIPVALDVGIGTLRGQIHVLPGVSPWETWQRSPSGFVAVTGAALDFPDGTTETAEVVLVSRHAAHSGLLPA